MTLDSRTIRRTVDPVDSYVGPVWASGIAALVLTKTGDFLTTVFGLVAVDGLIERNPVAAMAFEMYGIPGLLVLNLAGVAIVVLVVEWSVSWLRDIDQVDTDPAVLYLVSYVPLTMLYGFTTFQNTALIVTTGV